MNTVASNIPVDSLENLRNQLDQVHKSLRKLAEQLGKNPKSKLPSYPNLHGQFQVLIKQLQSIAAHLELKSDILRTTNAYPLPLFPTTQHEGLVTTLLRKKPLPEVDEWIESATTECNLFNIPLRTDDELAEWCFAKVKQLMMEFNFNGFYTETEMEYMESEEGRKKKARKDEEAEAKKKREKAIVGTKEPMDFNSILKFMTKGI